VAGLFRPFFPAGWLSFCLRTWAALVLALVAAFWLQLDAPVTAAVTVMIIAQPLRGQALSKAYFRSVGTFAGGVASVVLVALFPQERGMLLGSVAVWLALCAFVGTLERDFRAYAAQLAGYTVALVAVNRIDAPADVMSVALSRVSAVMVGIASSTTVNLLTASPQAWRSVTVALDDHAARVVAMTERALKTGVGVDDVAVIRQAGETLALTTRLSYARTELVHGRVRIAGARSALVAVLEALSCCRTVQRIVPELPEGSWIARRVRAGIRALPRLSEGAPGQGRLMMDLLAHHEVHRPGEVPAASEMCLIERATRFADQLGWMRRGRRALMDGRVTVSRVEVRHHRDVVLALVNALRMLIGFSLAAGLCVVTGLPNATTALAQTALILTLATTTFEAGRFGLGAVIGTPVAIFVAAFLDFHVLPHNSDMTVLALVLLPQTVVSCLLILNPGTAAIGLNYGIFFPVILGISNPHVYDPVAFAGRNVMYLFAAWLSFASLVLLLPPSARRRRFRVASALVFGLRAQFAGLGEQGRPPKLTVYYDRLAQIMTWTWHLKRGHLNRGHPKRGGMPVMRRMVAFGDLDLALAQAREALGVAGVVPVLAEAARLGLGAMTWREALPEPEIRVRVRAMRRAMEGLRASYAGVPAGERLVIVRAVAGLFEVSDLVVRHGAALRRYGVLRRGG